MLAEELTFDRQTVFFQRTLEMEKDSAKVGPHLLRDEQKSWR